MATYPEAIAAFAAKQTEFNGRLATAIDGVAGDVKTMKDLINTLQTTPGPISPEDQATLDNLQTIAEGAVTKAEALDNMTPPPAPPVTA
jgi:hypothetical protein